MNILNNSFEFALEFAKGFTVLFVELVREFVIDQFFWFDFIYFLHVIKEALRDEFGEVLF